jgi:Helicase conserved C-terminal domain
VQVGIQCVKLEGSMSLDKRNRTIKAFNEDPDVCCFLMSLKAGGVALNLTVASHVMLMDPWWNPAVEQQAQARAPARLRARASLALLSHGILVACVMCAACSNATCAETPHPSSPGVGWRAHL